MGCSTFSFRTINSCLKTIPHASNLFPSPPPPLKPPTNTLSQHFSIGITPLLENIKHSKPFLFHLFICTYLPTQFIFQIFEDFSVICLTNIFNFFIEQLPPCHFYTLCPKCLPSSYPPPFKLNFLTS